MIRPQPSQALKSQSPTSELADRVIFAIREQGFIRLSNIGCQSMGTTVQLTGVVPNPALKRIAREIAGKVPGVDQVEDHLRVIGS